MSLPRVYTADEVAEQLQICTKTVLKLVKTGRIARLPHLRGVRITEGSLRKYLQADTEIEKNHG